ncbi:MAG: putative bifunctional diguanylate cyclase/phosphodiesterase [Euzebya sp.]
MTLVAVLLLLFALGSMGLTLASQRSSAERQIRLQAESVGALYADIVTPVVTGTTQLDQIAGVLGPTSTVSAVLVLDDAGRPVVGDTDVHAAAVSRWQAEVSADGVGDTIDIAREGATAEVTYPLQDEGRQAGVLIFDLDVSRVNEDLVGLWISRLVAALLFVVGGTLVTFVLSRPTARRLRWLTAYAQDSAERVLPDLLAAATSGRIDPAQIQLSALHVGGSDEVGVLAQALEAHTLAVEELARGFAGQIAGADARFRAGFQRSPSAMSIVNSAGTIVEANQAFADLIGVADPELMAGQRWLGHVHEEDQAFCEAVLRGDANVEPTTIRYVRVNGEVAHVLQTWVTVTGPDGEQVCFLQGQDVSETRRATETLQHLAFTDLLTGLPNRGSLETRLAEIAKDVSPSHLAGMAMLDLDRFKLINDSLGHHEGDKVLRAVGKRLRAAIPSGAMVARTGGDEFAVVVTDLPEPEVMGLLAERLISVLEAPIAIGGRRFYVTASVGLAVAAHPSAVDALGAQADAASYAAKSSGRRRWLMFDSTMAQQATERLALENDLREALGDRQLELHYQPIVDSVERRLTGMEALVRWRHPERGLLSPDTFIGLAEDTGLITLLGWEVLDLALSDITRLDGVAGIDDTWRMSVNVSPAQLRHPEFVADVARKLRTHDVPAERLMLEITESMLVEDDIIDRLQDLRKLGIWVALDDFGTGYTGVAYLSRVGVDVLKVDRSIVQRANDERGYAVLRAIGQLGVALGMTVVAEGIETEEEARLATECSCDRLQGFGISRPVPVADIATRVLPKMARSN